MDIPITIQRITVNTTDSTNCKSPLYEFTLSSPLINSDISNNNIVVYYLLTCVDTAMTARTASSSTDLNMVMFVAFRWDELELMCS